MAVRFDAAADRLLRTTDLLDTNAAYTFMFWLYLTSDLNDYECIFTTNNNTFSEIEYIGFDDSAGNPRLVVYVDGGSGGANEVAGSRLNLNQLYHIAIVRASATSLIVYLDGVQDIVVTTNVTGRTAATRMEVGGVLSTNDDRCDGRVDRIKAFTTNLSQSDIQTEMDQIDPVRLDSLYGWWPCFAGATERLADYSGNGRDWTAAGTLTDEDGSPVAWSVPAPYSFTVATGVIVAPGAVNSDAAVIAPDVAQGAIDLAPAPVDSPASVADPSVVLGGLILIPAAIDALALVVDPDAILGALALSPAAIDALALAVDPDVDIGNEIVIPAALFADPATIDPAVELGSLILVPTNADADALVADPVVQVALVVVPGAVNAAAITVDPDVVIPDLVVAPAAVFAVGLTTGPVVLGNTITLLTLVRRRMGLSVRDRGS